MEAWSGSWVAERLDVTLAGDGLDALVGLALRRNPRRAHLLVSTVLGKHIPQRPEVVHDAGRDLGARVAAVLAGEPTPVVLGYAETATGLGHCVAEALPGATYLHSTRRPVAGVAQFGAFEEEHSHATSHLILPRDPQLLTGSGPLVLVDDELSTGRTVANTIRALHAVAPRAHYVIAALIDVRGPADRAEFEVFAAELGARVDVVALASGTVTLPEDVLVRGTELVAAHDDERSESGGAGRVRMLDLDWPADLPDGGRHGFTQADQDALEAALPALGAALAERVLGRRILVLGFEELMYTPLRLARALAEHVGADAEVRYSTTTRSPVLAVDDPGYAIRTRLRFPSHDDPADGPGARYAYNVAAGTDPARRFDEVLIVVDSVADTPELHAPGGLLDALSRVTDHVGLLVVPSFTPEVRRS